MRSDISRFAYRMESQLAEASERKGDHGWHDISVMDMLSAASQHEAAAKVALADLVELSNAGQLTSEREQELREQIAHAVADSANYLMMVADNAVLKRQLWTDRREEVPG